MNWEEREKIFSKDVITLEEFMKLLDLDKSSASILMNDIKKSLKRPRIIQRGKLHVQDYLDFYHLDSQRYMPNKGDKDESLHNLR